MRGLLAAAVLAGLVAAGPARADLDNYVDVERGRALVTAGDCVACHSSGTKPDFAGGRLIGTPFGAISSANLTPDADTGLGRWTAAQFYAALHDGVRPDGTHLYPAFPYTYYTRVTREDSDAMFAYLRTLQPAANPVDRNTLPFPFDIRTGMAAWNAMFFTPGTFKQDPARSTEYNRGAYLVEGLGHCGACHTPMNALGASKGSVAYQGNGIQDWIAPNITNDNRQGIGGWSVDQVVEYLQTGRNDVAAATGPMAEVVQYSTTRMPVQDLRAIAVYLKERGAAGTAANAVAATDPAMVAGHDIYLDTCSACHTANGGGIERLFPRLAGAPNIQQNDPANLLRVVLGGTKAAATSEAPTSPAMPALGWRLDDGQVAAVVTYIRNAWGNAAPAVTVGEVARMRDVLGVPGP